jgi:hypothetical protein
MCSTGRLKRLESRTGAPCAQRRLHLSPSLPACPTATLQPDSSGTVTLQNVRSTLIRQEDTIIFNIIERSQFARNGAVYTSGGVPVPAYNSDGNAFTFLEFLLRDTEAVHGRIRRFTSPDEYAFFPEALPPTVRFCTSEYSIDISISM